jgi:Fe-S-cluster containining protein
MREYINERESADGYVVGWLKKVGDEITDKCVFLKGSRSGKYYCGIYEARPHDCGDFTPIGCDDVDESLPKRGEYVVGAPFKPNPRGFSKNKR